jgi:hypothetical protein
MRLIGKEMLRLLAVGIGAVQKTVPTHSLGMLRHDAVYSGIASPVFV